MALLVKREMSEITVVEFPQFRDILSRERFAAHRKIALDLLDCTDARDHCGHHRMAQDETQRRLGQIRHIAFYEEL